MFHNFSSRYRTAALAASSFPVMLLASAARAADESGIVTTGLLAVITDGQAKGMLLALAVLSLTIAFKIVKKVSGAV